MAMNQWSKPDFLNKNKEQQQWVKNWNGFDGSPSLFIYKQDYHFSAWGHKPSDWKVSIDDRDLKTFKTKSQALHFAKQYMRTH